MNPNKINELYPLTASETKANDYVQMINSEVKPKSIFSDPNADFTTYWIYINRARDNKVKDEVMTILRKYMLDQ